MSDTTHMNIEVGCPVYIEINGINEKLKSKIIGFEHGEFLILRSPAGSAELRGGLNPNTLLVVKYVHHSIAYGFQTHVLTTINNPTNLIFIAYPQVVAEQSLRNKKRYDCHFACHINAEGSEKSGTVVDINTGGCCCTIPITESDNQPHLMAIGTAVELKIRKPDSEETITIRGSVSNITEDNSTARMGIAFQNMDDEIRNNLKELIFPLFVI